MCDSVVPGVFQFGKEHGLVIVADQDSNVQRLREAGVDSVDQAEGLGFNAEERQKSGTVVQEHSHSGGGWCWEIRAVVIKPVDKTAAVPLYLPGAII